MAYQEELCYLYGLERFGMIFGLDNVSRLLHLLGDPHLGLKVVHVAGTNGKGSVCTILHSILSQRYRVGIYTSPHLHRFNERIRIGHDEISDQEVVDLTRLLRAKVQQEGGPKHFTFFDFTTAMALYYFTEKGVELAIVEVGLGGRLDSTNVVQPLAVVITNIGHDHMDVLGESIEDIAREKAGVIKEGMPVVCGEGKPEALKVIEETALEKRAPLLLLGRDFSWEAEDGTFRFYGRKKGFGNLELNLRGRHQFANAALALATLEVLHEEGFPVGEGEIRRGLKEVDWPGRLELFEGPPKVLLDGAHNPEGAKALRCSLEKMPFRHLHLLLGIMADKAWRDFIAELAPLAETVVGCRPSNSRALAPEEIAREAKRYCPKVSAFEDPKEALEHLRGLSSPEDLIVVTGSLFTVADVREGLLGDR